MTGKVKYNCELLLTFCSDNHITLLTDYSNQKITRETRIEGKCLTNGCENTFDKSFRYLYSGNGYCNECSKEKMKATNLVKYGVKHSLQSKEVREKGKKTCLEKLGVEYPAQSQVIRDKMNETYFKNHWACMNSPDKTYEYIMKDNGDIWMVLKNDPFAEPEMIIEMA